MTRGSGVRAKPGRRPGEFVLELSPAWELRLRRVVREHLSSRLPDPREPGLSRAEREARRRARRQLIQSSVCQLLADLVMADIVGREVALATRSYFGVRRGSLREQVERLLQEITAASRDSGPLSPSAGVAGTVRAKQKG
ncbi:MAG: hypothetical protein N3C12_04430 [Candidatus Binatia bacterium]|nr:hypothetical protein [Candidatus Binatia bacterium]